MSLEYGRKRVDTAGKILAGRKQPTDEVSVPEALYIAGRWRALHGYPLQALYSTLRNRAQKIHADVLVGKRLKRMPSIIAKLRRFERMQLSQMQDLGGCRAVVPTIDLVLKLTRLYEHRPCKTAKLMKKYDYVAEPKPDGYRGVHLVYEYKYKRTNSRIQRAAYRNPNPFQTTTRLGYCD